MTNKIKTKNPVLFVAAILLCLVLITTFFTSGLFAKYFSKGSSDDLARVASFAIETDLDRVKLGTPDAPQLLLGGEDEIESVQIPFYITSTSEVAVAYSVRVSFGSTPLPDYVTLTLSDKTLSKTLSADGVKSEFVFSDFGSLPATSDTEQKAELTLTLSVSDLAEITDEISVPTANLTVSVYQVD